MSKIEILEKAGSTNILISLLKQKGKMYVTELKKEIGKGSMSTLNMRILELKNLGLINDELESKFGGRKYIWLTKKGKNVASYLLKIEQMI